MSSITRFAVLDVDNTLYPGTLGLTLLDGLVDAGICEVETREDIAAVCRAFRKGQIDFHTMLASVYRLFSAAMAGRHCAAVEEVAREVWRKERTKLFPFVPALVEMLRRRGYRLVVISGSPVEMIELLAKDLGVKDHHGMKCGRQGGRYTGTVDVLSGQLLQKRRIFMGMAGGGEIHLEKSFAMGDSMTDSALFGIVGKPVAFEPEPELLALARHRRWTIANRSNVLARATALLDHDGPRDVAPDSTLPMSI